MPQPPSLKTIGIIPADADGYTLIGEYSDGSRGTIGGWYSSPSDANSAAIDFVLREFAPDVETYARGQKTPADYGIAIEDWSSSDH